MELDYNKLSNDELNLLLKGMRDEYEVLKNTINNKLNRMEELDKKYSDVEKILIKRTKGKI